LLKKQKPIVSSRVAVVARRAHGAEGVVRAAVEHVVGGGHGGAGGAQRGAPGAGRGHRVGVERARLAFGLHLFEHVLQLQHITGGMRAFDLLERRERRVAEVERDVQAGGQQVVGDRVQPLGAFRVARTHIVQTALGMAVEHGGHVRILPFAGNVMRMDLAGHARRLSKLVDQISTVIVGKRPQIEDCVACLLAGGHLLIEDVPGVGKTTLAHALAVSLGLKFSRVQFTADLMPSDLVGVSVFERSRDAFVFHQGPLFAQVLLADEINRAGPKTQSALLEAMEEHQVSVENETRPLPTPFFVIGTQNPSDQLGTYPLPESQLDRFLLRITLGYPDRLSERALLAGDDRRELLQRLVPVMDPEGLVAAQRAVQGVTASEALLDYLQALIAATRSGRWFVEGLSPRAGIAVLRVAKARALMAERAYVAPDDVQAILPQAVAHRLQPVAGAGRGAIEQVRAMVEATPIP
jgi:MoxR-like ATPase